MRVFVLALMGLFFCAPAFGQTIDLAPGHVDLSPITNEIVNILGSVLLMVATWIGYQLQKWIKNTTGIQVSDSAMTRLNEAIDHGINWGMEQLNTKVNAVAGDVNVKNAVVATVLNEYVAPKFPQTMKTLGITPDHLKSMIEARLSSKAQAYLNANLPSAQ